MTAIALYAKRYPRCLHAPMCLPCGIFAQGPPSGRQLLTAHDGPGSSLCLYGTPPQPSRPGQQAGRWWPGAREQRPLAAVSVGHDLRMALGDREGDISHTSYVPERQAHLCVRDRGQHGRFHERVESDTAMPWDAWCRTCRRVGSEEGVRAGQGRAGSGRGRGGRGGGGAGALQVPRWVRVCGVVCAVQCSAGHVPAFSTLTPSSPVQSWPSQMNAPAHAPWMQAT